jgi:hypothetical protein
MSEATERRPRTNEWLPARDNRPRCPGVLATSAWACGPIYVLSELIEADLPDGSGVGPQWLVSISMRSKRPKRHHVRKALRAFGMTDAEEDNHHPGNARHFFMPVDPAHRVDCECKTDESVITDPDGYKWSNDVEDGKCRGCEFERLSGKPCPLHGEAKASA